MRAGRVGAAVIACGTLQGCGALLDLDVHYVGGSDGSSAIDGDVPDSTDASQTGSDAPAPDAPDTTTIDTDAGSPPGDGSPGDAELDALPPDGGGPAFVQGTAVAVDKMGMSASLAFTSDVQDHDTIVVALDYASTPGLTVSDSLGNSFQPALAPIAGSGTTCVIWYALDVQGGPDRS